MKMKTFTVILLLLTFCIFGKAQTREMFSDIPLISYCDLTDNAEKYDQQLIKVRAIYSRGFESSILFDENCKNEKVSWIKFTSVYKKNTDSNLLKKFRRLMKGSSQKKPPEIEILIVGKFDGKRQISTIKTPVKTFTFGVGYGHDDAFDYQINVIKLESVKTIREGKSKVFK